MLSSSSKSPKPSSLGLTIPNAQSEPASSQRRRKHHTPNTSISSVSVSSDASSINLTSPDSLSTSDHQASHPYERDLRDHSRPLPPSVTSSRRSSGFEVISRPQRRPVTSSSSSMHQERGNVNNTSPVSPTNDNSFRSSSASTRSNTLLPFPQHQQQQTVPPGTQILATLDNEQLTLVDISKCVSASAIRDRVLTRLHINPNDFSRAVIGISRIGASPDDGRSIDDAELWQLCSTGDPGPPTLFPIQFDSPLTSPLITVNPQSSLHASPTGSRGSSPSLSPRKAFFSSDDMPPEDLPSASSSKSYDRRRPRTGRNLSSTSTSSGSINYVPSPVGHVTNPSPNDDYTHSPRSPRASLDEESRSHTSLPSRSRARWNGWQEAEREKTHHYSRPSGPKTSSSSSVRNMPIDDDDLRPPSAHASRSASLDIDRSDIVNSNNNNNNHYMSSGPRKALPGGLPLPGKSYPPPPQDYKNSSPTSANSSKYDERYNMTSRRPPPQPYPQPVSQYNPQSVKHPPNNNQLGPPSMYNRGVRAAASMDDLRRQSPPPPPPPISNYLPQHSYPAPAPATQPQIKAIHRQPYGYPPPGPGPGPGSGPPQMRPYHPHPPQYVPSGSTSGGLMPVRHAPSPAGRYPVPGPPPYGHGPGPYPPRQYMGPPPPQHQSRHPVPPHGNMPPPSQGYRPPQKPMMSRSAAPPPMNSSLNPMVDYKVSHNRVRLQPGETLQSALSSQTHSIPIAAPVSPSGVASHVHAHSKSHHLPPPPSHSKLSPHPQPSRPKQLEFNKQEDNTWDIRPSSSSNKESDDPRTRRPSGPSAKREIPEMLRPGHRRTTSLSAESEASVSANYQYKEPSPVQATRTISENVVDRSSISSDASELLTPASDPGTANSFPSTITSSAPSSAAGQDYWQNENEYSRDDERWTNSRRLSTHGFSMEEKPSQAFLSKSDPASDLLAELTQDSEEVDDESSTVRDHDWARLVANFDGSSSGERTLVPSDITQENNNAIGHSGENGRYPTSNSYPDLDDDDDDDDDDLVTTWVRPMKALPSADDDNGLRDPSKGQNSVQLQSLNRSQKPTLTPLQLPTSQVPATHSPPRSPRSGPYSTGTQGSPKSRGVPGNSTPSSATGSENSRFLRPAQSGRASSTSSTSPIGRRGSFAVRENQWAFRPPVEQVYENLEEFFPGHDLDHTMVDAVPPGAPTIHFSSNANSFTSPQNEGIRAQGLPGAKIQRHKKSIRIVAQDRKRFLQRGERNEANGVSHANTTGVSNTQSGALLRRKSTKMWGARVEEVTPKKAFGTGTEISPIAETSANDDPENFSFKLYLGDRIGRGSFGEVFLAVNATTGDIVAVKRVAIPRTSSDRDDERQNNVLAALKSEIETLKDLDHPRIVQYLGFIETTDHLSVVLEYVAGGSVGRCLRKHGKFEPNLVAYFIEQVLDGLSYLHGFGILHRDMKCDNLLVEMNGSIKISDFGISKRTAAQGGIYDIDANMSMQGSIFWMAPEMVQNFSKGYSAKIDIWSLGCVCIEMFAGRRPWDNEQAIAAMFKLGKERLAPPIPDDVQLSADASNFISGCFMIEPELRPTATELLKHSFLHIDSSWKFEGSMLAKAIRE